LLGFDGSLNVLDQMANILLGSKEENFRETFITAFSVKIPRIIQIARRLIK
jgi:hypothetical protein